MVSTSVMMAFTDGLHSFVPTESPWSTFRGRIDIATGVEFRLQSRLVYDASISSLAT